MVTYTKLKHINLKTHPEVNERWVQNRIAEDPEILGLGDLTLKDMERRQPTGGRLDMLFQDDSRRYCVELQLGKTDETHIIRTIEYWDIEQKRYPDIPHVAVIIAEEITSRLFNVIGILNRSVPLIAIQLHAVDVNGEVGLQFVKVLDESSLPTYEEDEEPQATVDLAYWEARASKETVSWCEEVLNIVREATNESLNLNYTKRYIGFEESGIVNNFVAIVPRKKRINLRIRLTQSEEIDALIEEAGLDRLEYNKKFRFYVIPVSKEDIVNNKELLQSLFEMAYEG
ncbi:hypothetical protein CON36_34650 [Bacillus cereus]|uniref:DUF5655 domain-containing protein n=2 Tax=Bacillus cereus group TaxID=86661 RepID=A0A9X6XUZ0_BACCE|nr:MULTISPECIES: hypothetical protein [Bacillus cereus group]PDZ94277.1 hypothetical protein CON36_34650 [Bacillus cereus]PFJ29036.1 hypothetical protein COJ15_32755 [Bacillus thuringiensis]PGP14643.1 hypothetical protein COA01_30285 [Bacillus cereus]